MASNSDSMSKHAGLDPAMLTGVPFIDAEHSALVQQLDLLVNQSGSLPNSEAFLDVLSQIGTRLHSHFINEEGYLESCGMPSDEVHKHVQAHSQILEEYTALNIDLMNGKALSPLDVLLMVKNWIIDHLVAYDLEIRRYVPASQFS